MLISEWFFMKKPATHLQEGCIMKSPPRFVSVKCWKLHCCAIVFDFSCARSTRIILTKIVWHILDSRFNPGKRIERPQSTNPHHMFFNHFQVFNVETEHAGTLHGHHIPAKTCPVLLCTQDGHTFLLQRKMRCFHLKKRRELLNTFHVLRI